jgi:hypothetical protein
VIHTWLAPVIGLRSAFSSCALPRHSSLLQERMRDGHKPTHNTLQNWPHYMQDMHTAYHQVLKDGRFLPGCRLQL